MVVCALVLHRSPFFLLFFSFSRALTLVGPPMNVTITEERKKMRLNIAPTFKHSIFGCLRLYFAHGFDMSSTLFFSLFTKDNRKQEPKSTTEKKWHAKSVKQINQTNDSTNEEQKKLKRKKQHVTNYFNSSWKRRKMGNRRKWKLETTYTQKESTARKTGVKAHENMRFSWIFEPFAIQRAGAHIESHLICSVVEAVNT